MFFDRYEIHIQAFGNVFIEIYHLPILISTKKTLRNEYSNYVSKTNVSKKKGGHTFQNIDKFRIVIFSDMEK